MINLSNKLAEESDMNIKGIGTDLAKQIFQGQVLRVRATARLSHNKNQRRLIASDDPVLRV